MKRRRDWSKIEAFELALEREPASYEHNRKVYEGLYRQARKLGLFPSGNPLDGVETDSKVAKILNALRRAD